MAEGTSLGIHIVLPAVAGLAIGLVEAYFIYEDESSGGLNGFFGKVWHGIIFAIIGVLITMNVPWIINSVSLPEWIMGILYVNPTTGVSLTACILVFLIMFVKIDMAKRIRGVGSNGFTEKLWHKLAVAAMIGFAPYYLMFLYSMPAIANLGIPLI